uniref:RHS repeat-associated core domain-containing protein n=1 Tax=Candidatus Kentrum sp. TC TaxID=2126339 RepID=A0A450YWE5_9GAMM|nr:MAG: RHS repeat-associated core domain-containing protein [Candidatus Kentron sp. TC]
MKQTVSPLSKGLRSLIFFVLLPVASSAWAGNLDEAAELDFSSPAAQPLKRKADELGSAVRIYEYVRNRFEYALYHGSRSGAVNTFLGRRGNDVDQASTLIAMLRSQGIPAEYAVGVVEVTSEEVMNWLGVRNLDLAVAILDDQGIQDVSKSADGATVQFEHAWVRALVAMDNYRGSGKASGIDCAATPDRCRWVELAPSFKLREYHNQNIDLYDLVQFDFDAYYSAAKNNDVSRMNKNPLEIYEEQILDYLRVNHPGRTLEDVADPGVIIREEHGILPLSLPFHIVGSVAYFDSVASHDASGAKFWKKMVSVELNFGDSFSFHMGSYSLVDLATKRLTLGYELGNPERLVARLDGVETVVPLTMDSLIIDGTTVGLGYPFDMTLSMDGVPATRADETDAKITAEYQNLVVGGYYLIGIGGDSSNWSQVHRSADRLLAANEQYPIINDAEDIPYVDVNGDGAIDAGDKRLLDHPDAMDALTGGLLFSAMNRYFAGFRDNIRRFDQLNHVISPIQGFIGVVSSVYEVEYLDDTAFSIMPGGLLIDMKGQAFGGIWRIDMPAEYAPRHFDLIGHSMSSLEHEVWQEITGFDAFSTVRGIQMTLANNDAVLLNPKKNATKNTLSETYATLGFETHAPAPFVLHDRQVFSTNPVTWSHPENYQYMDLMKADVDPDMDQSRLMHWIYVYETPNSGPEAWVRCVDEQENFLKQYISWGYGNYQFSSPFQLCDGATLSPYATLYQVLTEVENHYFNTVIPYYIGQNYMDSFDRNKGFVPEQYIYRNYNVPTDHHNGVFVRDIRNNISLITSDHWREYFVPSRKTSGDLYRFTVYLDNQYHRSTDEMFSQSFTIVNESMSAGGGYVDAIEAMTQSLDTTGLLFNNEIFTDRNLNALANNDLVRTPSTADPVSTVTGNMYHDETDITIRGRGLDYTFTRTYNSAPVKPDTIGKPFGFGWTHSYNMRLIANDYGEHPNFDASQAPENANGATSSITYVDERGGEINYLVDDQNGTWAVTPPQGYFDTLALDTPTAGQHTLTFGNGIRYVFDAQGADIKVPGVRARLSAIQDPYGNRMDLQYDPNGNLIAIRDNTGISGRTGLTLTYNEDGRITGIGDWTGRAWRYEYDTFGNLTAMIGPESLVSSTYTYHPGTHLLHTIGKPELRDGAPVMTTFDYYRNNKTFDYVDALGHTETLDYDLYRRRTRVTNPRGGVREYSYDNNGALIKLREPDGALLTFENTIEGLRYGKTDGVGYTTRYSYRLDRTIGQAASDTGGQVTLEQDPLGATREYDYGIHNQPTRIRDRNGNERHITYYAASDDASGALAGKRQHVRATLDGALVTLETWTWNANGTPRRRTQYIDAAGARQRFTDYTYDASGLNLLEVRVSATGISDTISVAYTYDQLGRKLTETTTRRASATDATPLALATTYGYDALGRVIETTDPLGVITETVYDKNGKVGQEKVHYRVSDDPVTYDTRIVATHAYDAADRRIGATDVDGNVTRFGYDEAGNLIQKTDANGHVTRYEYDAMNRRTVVVDANGHRTETTYDLAGNVTGITDPNGNTTAFAYDAAGRRISTTTPMGSRTFTAYDANGNVTGITDANAVLGAQPRNAQGATVSRQYDEMNRLVRIIDAKNRETAYRYDLLGNLTAITDAEGRTTTFVHDDLGRLIETIDPLIETPSDRTVTLTHDEMGNVSTRTDREGRITRYTYDLANRLVLTEYLIDGTQETRQYDAYGNLATLANDDVTYTYTYDHHNRLATKTDTRETGNGPVSRTLRFEYDLVGNLIRKTDYQGEVTDYQYDSANRLVALANKGYLQVSYHYDGGGRLLDRILSNGVKTRYAYDRDNRLLELANTTANGTVIHAQRFEYDHVGNITRITDQNGQSIDYAYDPLYRLVVVDAPDTDKDRSFGYDGVGNRVTQVTAGETLAYLYDVGNRLREVRSGGETGPIVASYQYDHNGSRLEKRDGAGGLLQAYQYDPKRRIRRLTQNVPGQGEVHADYAYDPNDYRIRKGAPQGVDHYLLQAEHLESIYDDQDRIQAKYLRGVVVDEIVNGYEYPNAGDEKTRVNLSFHHDHNKSVTGLSAHEGSLLETIGYEAFGNVAASTGESRNRLRYTGREQDAGTGLYYYRARYYDPEVGRFLTEDPLGFEAGINFYRYVDNNPVNFNDPSGMIIPQMIGGAVNALAGIGINIIGDEPITPAGVITDFVTGAAGVGIASKFAHLSKLAQVGAGAATSSGLFVSGEAAKNTVGIVADGKDFNFENVTQGITPGKIATSALLSAPFSNVGDSFAGNLPAISTNVFEQTAVKIGFQTPVNIAKGVVSGKAGEVIDNHLSNFDFSPLGSGQSASGGFVRYPSKPNINSLQGVYRK